MIDLDLIRAQQAEARSALALCSNLRQALEWAIGANARLADELERTRETLAQVRIATGRQMNYVGKDSGK